MGLRSWFKTTKQETDEPIPAMRVESLTHEPPMEEVSTADTDRLATYNGEVLRGIVHTPKYDAEMVELQKKYNLNMERSFIRREARAGKMVRRTPSGQLMSIEVTGINNTLVETVLAMGTNAVDELPENKHKMTREHRTREEG